ncbi:MAG: nucleoside deaminase [Coprobacillus sp.]|nr:nucleoside deaminase [Coprobacillus sp.]
MEKDAEFFMTLAINEAKSAMELDEVPVGAIIVKDGEVIASAHNTRESEQSPLGHAELTCIKKASEALGSWRLSGCDLYVTLEPCMMCAGAIIESRINRLYIGALDSKNGAIVSQINLLSLPNLSSKPQIFTGVLKENCEGLLTFYFKNKRN